MTMDCLVQQPIWTGAYHHGGLAFHHHHHYFSPYYFPRKRTLSCSYFSGLNNFSRLDDDVGFPTEIKVEPTEDCLPEDDKDIKICVVCGERASGYYFGALVCLPCKSFYIRCTKDGEPNFTCQCNGNCDIAKQGRIRCQYCRYQRCLMAGMCRKEKPETVQPAEGQVLCKVCGDIANGIHFGVNTCEGCKKFFRRGLVENQSYICKGDKNCSINPRNRNTCRFCRYQKCISEGMSREAIKMGRPKKTESTDNGSNQSPVNSPSSSVDVLSDNNSQSSFNDNSLSPRPVVAYSPSSSSPPYHPSTSPSVSLENEDSSVLLQCMLRGVKDFKTEESLNTSCQHQEMTQNHGMAPVTSDVTFMTRSSPNDVCSHSSNTHSRPSYSTGHSQAWTNENQMNWHRPSQPVHSNEQSENPVSFAEEDMDEILDYLQPEPSSRKGVLVNNTCTKSKRSYEYGYMEGHNTEFNYHSSSQYAPQQQCIMGNNMEYPYPAEQHYGSASCQHQMPVMQQTRMKQLSIDTTQYQQPNSPPYHRTPVYSSSPAHNSYPSSPESYTDHPHSPVGSVQGSPSHSVQYPHSPVCSVQGSPAHNMQYPHSPVRNGQCSPGYPNSPASDVSYPGDSSSPVQCNQYYGSSPTGMQYLDSQKVRMQFN